MWYSCSAQLWKIRNQLVREAKGITHAQEIVKEKEGKKPTLKCRFPFCSVGRQQLAGDTFLR